jgi:hypothetical protein
MRNETASLLLLVTTIFTSCRKEIEIEFSENTPCTFQLIQPIGDRPHSPIVLSRKQKEGFSRIVSDLVEHGTEYPETTKTPLGEFRSSDITYAWNGTTIGVLVSPGETLRVSHPVLREMQVAILEEELSNEEVIQLLQKVGAGNVRE